MANHLPQVAFPVKPLYPCLILIGEISEENVNDDVDAPKLALLSRPILF